MWLLFFSFGENSNQKYNGNISQLVESAEVTNYMKNEQHRCHDPIEAMGEEKEKELNGGREGFPDYGRSLQYGRKRVQHTGSASSSSCWNKMCLSLKGTTLNTSPSWNRAVTERAEFERFLASLELGSEADCCLLYYCVTPYLKKKIDEIIWVILATKKKLILFLLVSRANFFHDDANEHRLFTLTDLRKKNFSKITIFKLKKK